MVIIVEHQERGLSASLPELVKEQAAETGQTLYFQTSTP
jgi:hypothetical protein